MAEWCEKAIKIDPALRLRYQLARSYQSITRKKPKARQLLDELVRKNYPAAFDNLGDLYLEDHDIETAAQMYSIGIRLGDPDAAFSYAVLMKREGNMQAAIRALRKAASLGHERAREILQRIEQKNKLGHLTAQDAVNVLNEVFRQFPR